ncbi:MAG: glycerophosphodiester phosphodiesterase family protein [Hyphomonas sp.]|uniref:glycerophosphodiester phosphodiesterase family protein n=1 Tax=Hyphomonas sp. TaxID=87 RepID=UPI0035283CA7
MKRFAFSAAVLVLLGACGQAGSPPAQDGDSSIDGAMPAIVLPVGQQEPAPPMPLPDYFDCLRRAGGTVIAAHRGGPDKGFPENAIETFQHGFDRGIRVFEIDVAETRDGVLTLMHDDRLNRTTTGKGYVSDTDWETMSGLWLEDNDGRRTQFHPPKFSDVLLWAKETGAILELDKKPTTSFANIAAAVRAAGAEESVIFISYNDDQAAEIAAIDPDFMMTASAFGGRDVAALEARGIDRTRLVAWTGTEEPDAAAWKRLVKEGIEPAFGTLGRAGERLDDAYLADGDGSEYDDLARQGLVLIATDFPYEVADLISSDDTGRAACGR